VRSRKNKKAEEESRFFCGLQQRIEESKANCEIWQNGILSIGARDGERSSGSEVGKWFEGRRSFLWLLMR
jgi:hypothetical protein